jgi:hypothetical protein
MTDTHLTAEIPELLKEVAKFVGFEVFMVKHN